GVAVVRRVVDDLRGDARELALHVAGHGRLGPRLDPLARAGGDRGPRGVGLEAAIVAALAAAPVGIDGHMADLAGDVGGAVIDLAVEHDAAADPGADREADDVVRAARRAAPPFAEDGAVRVVVEGGGQSQRRSPSRRCQSRRRSAPVSSMAASTRSTDSSRMHLWWPSGQAGGPWSEQGRQASPTSPTLTSVSRTGPNPNSGIVGPNTAT